MGLSLNNIFQRPYVKQDTRTPVKKREDEEKSSAANAQRQQESGQNTKSKGLQYVEQKQQAYTPAYEQKFAMPTQNAYSGVNINSAPARTPVQTTPVQEQNISKIDNKLGWKAKVSFEEGVQNVLDNIEYWREAPVWTPNSIEVATEDWFRYLGK